MHIQYIYLVSLLICSSYFISSFIFQFMTFTGFQSASKILNSKGYFQLKLMNELDPPGWLKIQRIKSKLAADLEQKDFQVIHKAQRRISEELLYFLKILHLNMLTSLSLPNMIKQCIKIIATLVRSTEAIKFGHKLTSYAFVVKKYLKLTCQELQLFDQELALIRTEKNEQSNFYKSLDSTPMSKEEILFAKSASSSCFFANLNNNQLKLHNNQCLCCSQVFYKNIYLTNFNPYFSNVIGLSSVKAFEKGSLQKYAIAICNQGGGVILIGTDKKQKNLSITGMKFKDMRPVKNCENQIKLALNCIKPACRFIIQRVPVQERYTQTKKTAFSNNEIIICFRVVVLSNPIRRFTFIEGYKKGSEKCYKSFVMNNDTNEAKQIQISKGYSIIQSLYRKKEQFKNIHKGISCLRVKKIENNNLESQSQPESESSAEEVVEVKKQYANTSILVLTMPHIEKIVAKFMRYMKEANQNFTHSRPFLSTFKNLKQCYWLVNHDGEYEELVYLLRQFTKREGVESGVLGLYPVYKIVEVQSTTFNQQIEKNLGLKLVQEFKVENCYQKKTVQAIQNKQLLKKITYIKFQEIEMSLFSYLYFQQISLKPQFINQEQSLVNF